ncbi:acyltransferase [Caballeronia sp. LZ029]|uniref:acyltransferase family protein n=1 Tax=Caballeronia sp. LZ029 TaxID=3038564 RepID=UPI002855CA5E|nr:acyltransferase [Caballeronia sp. LZ029]MDR5742503.1 acyltransferase [Caballeronia sp. LZ029]
MRDAPIDKNTSAWLDVMRGGAAQAVLLGHLYQLFFFGSHGGPESQLVMLIHAAIIFVSRYSHEAVIVFFVLSGYLVGGPAARSLMSGQFSWKEYLPARLTRLWTVLLPCLVLTFALDMVATNFGTGLYFLKEWASIYPRDWVRADTWSLERLFANAAFLIRVEKPMFGSNISLWSLTNEFWYYVTLPAIVTVFIGGKAQRIFSAFALLSVAYVIYRLHNLSPGFIAGFGIWMLGAILHRISARKSAPYIALALLLTSGCLLWSVAPNPETIAHDALIGAATAGVIGLARFVPARGFRAIGRFFAGYSFSLYAIHLPVLVLLFSFDPLTAIDRPYGGYDLLRFIGYAVATNLAAMAFWFAFEKRTASVKRALRGTLLLSGSRGPNGI